MPLRCIDESGNSIQAFDLPDDGWHTLHQRNRKERHLRMTCCASPVALKRSRLGTQFFAHKAKGTCTTAPETEIHLRLKQIAVRLARAHGWDAETEVSGFSPTGEEWRADVLARKGDAKVAVEIQWSSQTPDETLRRQERYRASGVRGLWLVQKGSIPVTRELPAASIVARAEHSYDAVLSSGQRLPLDAFLDAAFGRRLKYGIPHDVAGTISMSAARTKCWHDRCRADTIIVTSLGITFGPYRRDFSVSDFNREQQLFDLIYRQIPLGLKVGSIKPRFSKTMEASYLSNGCVKCDRIFGQHFEIAERYNEQVICEMPILASGRWRDIFTRGQEDLWGWGVFRPEELPVPLAARVSKRSVAG